ncbi:hypothetical protein RclHR1_01920006 [Rhizophagus clarus]|uniref:F-box domain-containing protein n=1 Tax=Rhizophagus clarus TaxID=94130 RepID=A0A2Z6QTA0_9GLOM|nr:hypothetical protein RclHR1_01920006 [Rhizophagus clarus]GES84039.1 hypothetical protein GLOIN_2v1770968 [Rhizophagus clarus]
MFTLSGIIDFNFQQNKIPHQDNSEKSLSKTLFLPEECLQEIFSYFSDDASTLSQCLLVNKFWFKSAASILWKSPFGQLQNPSAKLIETYIKFLDIRSKTILSQIGISSSSCSSFSTPEFIYAQYVKTLCYKGLYESACTFIFGDNCGPKDLEGEKKCLTLVRELSLFLIRKCPSIYIMSYDTEEIDFYVQDIYLSSLNLIPEVCQLFKRVRKLTCGGKYKKGSLMNVMSSHCKNLITLELNFYEFDMYLDGDRKEPSLMSTLLLEQKDLRNLIIRGPFRFLPDVLAPVVSQSKSLSLIHFERVHFNNLLPLESVATCRNLETMIFIDCKNLNDETLIPLASTSFLRLKKLIFKNAHRSRLDNLARLIQKTKGSLREIRFRRREFKNMVISNVPDIPINVTKTISTCCPNLIIFEGHLEKETMPHFLTMLNTTFLEKLFISLEFKKNFEFFRSQVAFQLPETLYHLSISIKDRFSVKDLEQFLELCSAPLISLQFPQSSFIDDNYLDVITDFAEQVGSLKKVIFSKNSLITEKGIQKARQTISFVKKNGEEV